MGSTIRPFRSDDATRMQQFSEQLPDADRNFFKEDVLEPGVLDRWFADSTTRRLVVVDDDDEIVGYAGVLPLTGWSRHVAELRLIVRPDRRGHGIGTALVRAGLQEAFELGCTKIVVDAISDQIETIGMLQNHGFEPEAILRAHVRDRSGELRDLLVLAHHADDNLQALHTLGVVDALGGG